MSKIIIGIDPDSKKHGVAVYKDKKITELDCFELFDIHNLLFEMSTEERLTVEFHVEDVCANNAIFRKGNNVSVQQSIARRLGMVQQSQVELERLAEWWELPVVKHKISKMWKKDKAQFEKVTGWKGRSNEDTRSAAYFGWLGCSK